MSLKKTFAVIGLSKFGILSVLSKIGQNNNALIFDATSSLFDDVFSKSRTAVSNSEVEIATCPIDASWEADIIVISDSFVRKAESIKKITKVSTGKTVIIVDDNEKKEDNFQNSESLLSLFPYSNVRTITEAEIENFDFLLAC
ncbi:hypothetical protein [Flavobacterium sp. PL12]|uniref:hypothetical protein n=1 Tax=Flavobacterium sp. PL12 TaxID=3071718 RepID=UPI00319DBFF5